MSQQLRHPTTTTQGGKNVPDTTQSGTYMSPVVKLREKLSYLSGRTPYLQDFTTRSTPKISTRFSTGFPGRKMVLGKNHPSSPSEMDLRQNEQVKMTKSNNCPG